MLRPFQIITITQVTPFYYKDDSGQPKTIIRDRVLVLDFVHEYTVENGWENHTGNATVTFPKNVILQQNKFLFQQTGTYSVILGGTLGETKAPLLLRGDKITIQDGYRYVNENRQEVETGTTLFVGFITKVYSDIPIVIECEDNFYLLKKTPIGITKFPVKTGGSTRMLDFCQLLLDNVNKLFPTANLTLFKLPDAVMQKFSLGYLDIDYQTMSCAQILQKLSQRYGVKSFFVNNELWFCFEVYDESRANSSYFFEFQNNIITENLEYTNKGDVVLSTVVSCQTIQKLARTTRAGVQATKRFKKTVYVYWDYITEDFKYFKIDVNHPLPPNEGGERHQAILGVALTEPEPSVDEMGQYGISQLKKYYYTGFRGSFTTFGFPHIEWNDNVNLSDKFIADRDGQYKVKKVKYSGGVGGRRQEIFLDFKFNIPPVIPKNEVYML